MSSQKRCHSKTLGYITAFLCLANEAFAKGLDKLQAEPDKSAEELPVTGPAPSSEIPAEASKAQSNVQAPPPAVAPSATSEAPSPAVDRLYFATGASWLSLSGDKGDWSTALTGDIEAGYRVLTPLPQLEIFASYRYRPCEFTVKLDQREYRGIAETHLFGAKGRWALNSKLAGLVSTEIGASQTHITSNDSLLNSDQSLEKSGVDLSIGGGVSYIVIDKVALGTKLVIGAGAYKTVQIGFDVRLVL